MQATVLIIEDDEALRELLQFHLSQAGFLTLDVDRATEAWSQLERADVIVLDWMLPDMSGIDWLQRLRNSEHARLPVLMLTARASEIDKVTGLNAGADDYLVKPFSAAELVARLQALLRRLQPIAEKRIGDLLLDDAQGLASFKDVPLQLTRREFELLSFMMAHPGRVFSRSDLLDRVWGKDFLGTDRTVDQHIAQLRARIGIRYIETLRGRGYRLVDIGDTS